MTVCFKRASSHIAKTNFTKRLLSLVVARRESGTQWSGCFMELRNRGQ